MPRKRTIVAALTLVSAAAGFAQRETPPTRSTIPADMIAIQRRGSEPSRQGSPENFSGSVHIDSLFAVASPSRVGGARVTFEPGARTAWHAHPLGQVLIVTEGVGWVKQWGGSLHEIRQGDVVRIPPGQKHWHGATATTGMTHIALQEELAGKVVDWMEKVSDGQYRKR